MNLSRDAPSVNPPPIPVCTDEVKAARPSCQFLDRIQLPRSGVSTESTESTEASTRREVLTV